VRGEPPEAAQHVGHVGAEDPPEQVELVDHDVAQPGQQPHPAGMVREDPAVQHLGVGEQHRGVSAGVGPLVATGVAVVGHGSHPGEPEVGERAQLVLRQRLRRVDADRRARPDGLGRRLPDRGLVHERLARGRARGHHHRTTGPHEVERLDLVRPEPVDPQPLGDRRRQRPDELAVASGDGGEATQVH